MPDKVQAETDKTVDVPKEAVREPADTPESKVTEGVQDSLPGLEPGERPKTRRPRQEEVLVRVRRRDRDEIDLVVDAFWVFVGKVRNASRPYLALGVLLVLLGLSLAGWPQGFVGESQGGYWSLRGADQSSLARYTTEGDYVEFTPGEKVTVEGVIDGMEYYGPLEALPLPLLGPEPQSSEGEALRNGTSDVLFPPLQQIFAQGAAANYSNTLTLERYHFPELEVDGFLFNDVVFREVVFEDVTFRGGFFINCHFEQVAFYNVTLVDTVISHGEFEDVLFQSSSLERGRLEHSEMRSVLLRESEWRDSVLVQSELHGVKWDGSWLTNVTLQKSTMRAVVFQGLSTVNVTLVNSRVEYVADGDDLDYTYLELRGATLRLPGDVALRYPVGASIYLEAVVVIEGNSSGQVQDGNWVSGTITGEGFSTPHTEHPVTFEHELLTSRVSEIQPTFWWSLGFHMLTGLGLWVLVFAIGGEAVLLALLKFFAPFFATLAGFLVMFLTIPTRDFLLVSQLMFLYFVPPFGKGTVIPLGIAAGVNPWVLAAATAFVDIMVGIFLAWNFDLARRIPFVGGAIRRAQAKGHEILEQRPWVGRIAFVGILLFVMFPFQGSGSVGGTLLGRAMGMEIYPILGAVTIGGVLGSVIIAASVVFGLGLAGKMGTYGLLIALLLVMILVTIIYIFSHWDELSLDEFQDVLGLHREGFIGAQVGAAADLAGAATSGVFRAVGETGQVISKTTATVLDAFMPEGGPGEEAPIDETKGESEDDLEDKK